MHVAKLNNSNTWQNMHKQAFWHHGRSTKNKGSTVVSHQLPRIVKCKTLLICINGTQDQHSLSIDFFNDLHDCPQKHTKHTNPMSVLTFTSSISTCIVAHYWTPIPVTSTQPPRSTTNLNFISHHRSGMSLWPLRTPLSSRNELLRLNFGSV